MGTTFIFTVVILSVLGLLLAVILFLVAKKFNVEEDPLIDVVEATMPGANCGGCGFAGCRAFAEACVKSRSLEGKFCPVGGNAVMQKVAAVMGVQVEEKVPMVAVVRCNGTCRNRVRVNEYDGSVSCRIMSSLYAGDTGCRFGCLGGGDCEKACQFGAIRINPETLLPEVDEEKCTACGACVRACPKGIIELRNKGPKSRRVYVSCMSQDKGAVARSLARLEARGLVERTVPSRCRREKMVTLTPAGEDAAKEIETVLQEWQQVCYRGFSLEERQTYEAFLTRIIGNVLQFKEEEQDG